MIYNNIIVGWFEDKIIQRAKVKSMVALQSLVRNRACVGVEVMLEEPHGCIELIGIERCKSWSIGASHWQVQDSRKIIYLAS